MTAEIAIANKQAVVLAADSAITIGRERVWKHANKIFSLGPGHDIGIMIYNAGDFLGIPWEVIIKEFRSSCSNISFPTLQECSVAFRHFLGDLPHITTSMKQFSIISVLLDIIDRLHSAIDPKTKDLAAEIKGHISNHSDTFDSFESIPNTLREEEFRRRYKKVVGQMSREIFNKRLRKDITDDILLMIFRLLTKQYESEYSTGMVFAGHGTTERLPALQECVCDGFDDDLFRFWNQQTINLGGDDAPASILRPFGQADIAFLFVEGIAVQHVKFIETALSAVLKDKSDTLIKDYVSNPEEKIVEAARQSKDNSLITERLMDGFRNYRRGGLVSPLMKVVTNLPKAWRRQCEKP